MSRERLNTDTNGVSRRSFNRRAALAGLTVGLAGCSGDSGGDGGGQNGDSGGDGGGQTGDNNTDADSGSQGTTTGSTGDENVTLVYNNSLSGEVWEAYEQALRDSGLPDSISFELSSLPESNRTQQWEQWLSTGREEPDLFMIKSTVGRPFMYRGQLQGLNSLIKDETKQTLEEHVPTTLLEFFRSDGELYGVPLLFDFSVIQYRKDLVEEAGFDPSDWQSNPLSWKEFATTMSQVADQTDVKNGYGWTAASRSRDQPFFEAMKSYGGSYWGDNEPAENLGSRDLTLNQKQGVQALRTQLSMIYGQEYEHSIDGIPKIAPEAVLQWLDTPVVQNMSGGNLASIWNFTWSIPELGAEGAYGENLGVMPNPYGVPQGEGEYEPGGGSRTVAAAWHIAINPNSQNKEAAAKVLDAMVTADSQLTLFEEQGYAPPRTDLYESERLQNMDVIGRYTDALSYAVNHVGGSPSLNPLWSGMKQRLNDNLGTAYRRETDPQSALDTAREQMQRYESQNADQFSG